MSNKQKEKMLLTEKERKKNSVFIQKHIASHNEEKKENTYKQKMFQT